MLKNDNFEGFGWMHSFVCLLGFLELDCFYNVVVVVALFGMRIQ